jgi:hypothetical protein
LRVWAKRLRDIAQKICLLSSQVLKTKHRESNIWKVLVQNNNNNNAKNLKVFAAINTFEIFSA